MRQKLYLLAHPKRTYKVNGCNTPLEGGNTLLAHLFRARRILASGWSNLGCNLAKTEALRAEIYGMIASPDWRRSPAVFGKAVRQCHVREPDGRRLNGQPSLN